MRRIVVVLLIAALVAAALFGFNALRESDGTDGESGQEAAPPAPVIEDAPDVEIDHTPGAWHIVYRLEEHGGEEVTVSTDKVWVSRPFESRLETWSGPPPGERQEFVQVGSFARRGTQAADAERLVLRLPPSAAPSDVRVLPILETAETEGLLVRREVREILDRRCQVFRSGSLLSAPALTEPTEDNYAETCIDSSGLVLEEKLVDAGELLSRRIAIEVDEAPDLGSVSFTMPEGEPVPVEKGGGVIQPLTLDSRAPGEFFELPAPPPGFSHRARLTVIPPQPDNFSDFAREGFIFGGVTDVYERGEDFVAIDQWGTLRGQDLPASPPAIEQVEVDGLGTGGVSLSGAGSELRFDLPGGRFIRLRGPVEPNELTRIARELVRVEGGELVPLPTG